ncbi:hypothetical protein NEAUS06_1576 [Nematocida ausubeli]|nr:hypothetical protein NEAUS06_1576 [Nematocida ausubeli]
MVNKWKSMVILWIPCLISQVVLLDDIEAPERHGDITIDSTNNKVDHISRKIRMKTALNPQNIPYERHQHSRYIAYPPDSMNKLNMPHNRVYSIERDTSIKIAPVDRRNYAHASVDRRIEELLQDIEKTKKEQAMYTHTQEDLETKKQALDDITNSKITTEQSIAITRKEIFAVENTLQELKNQLQGLSVKESNMLKEEAETKKEINHLQAQLTNKEVLLHRLRKLKKKYKWLRSEYNYYEADSSTNL